MGRRACGLAHVDSVVFPIVDDPGDHYDFAANHLFLAGIQF
jgi:hypothetical protein